MHGQQNIKKGKESSNTLREVKNQRLQLNRTSRHLSISKCGWDETAQNLSKRTQPVFQLKFLVLNGTVHQSLNIAFYP